ncbi:hypothetical protein [Bradyrhizobium sp. NAS80.1]|uniref:hypothetical protein n=1 Tax=Bradyrhizobium sp. NAS80.1 TaxID=1680159 RepID=UPI000B1648C5|nr:hypothetical protein [Bradyrhizobium sp. NAS80.1]
MSRFFIGCDLGQSNDPTALAVVQRAGEHFRCGHLERLPLGTSYPAVVARVGALMHHRMIAGDVSLAIDATGVGRPVCDMFAQAGIPFTGVVITAGHDETPPKPGSVYRHVPKITLISHVQALLHAGKLKIRSDLPEASNLVRELQDFKVSYSATGYMSFNAREGAHDDLVLALSIAIWCALRTKTGQESWAEYLERGDWRSDPDSMPQPIEPFPEWGFSNEPLVLVWVPPSIASEGMIGKRTIRWSSETPYIETTRSEARQLMSQAEWRANNEDLARELEATP